MLMQIVLVNQTKGHIFYEGEYECRRELPPPAAQGGICAVELPKKSQLPSRLLGDQVVGQVLDDRQPVVKTVPGVNLYVLVVHTARGEQAVE
jgi:hypothetical protein